MTASDGIPAGIAHALDRDIVAVDPTAGGCISPAFRLTCADGGRLFLKMAPAGAPDDMLAQEASSLRQIARTGTVRVPEVHAVNTSWLVLEWLEPSRGSDAAWRELGRALAMLHRTSAPQFGWESANCIGVLPQANEWTSSWASFWREQRLRPQLVLAEKRLGAAALKQFERLFDELDERLDAAEHDGPSMVHGDLWSGNVHFTGGNGALIDPSSCYGHREVDLAMAALFGGFPASFFDAYSAAWPLIADAASRRPIYQLYYLLVHVNLFGGGYIEQTRRLLDTLR